MEKRSISACILIAYSAILIKLVVFKGMLLKTRFLIIYLGSPHTGPANFVPFKTILPYLRGEPIWQVAINNLVGNTALFVPIGFLVPLVYPKMTWQKSLALAAAVGLAMEGMEVVFRMGIFDVDDLVLNAFGVMIGYLLFTCFATLELKQNTMKARFLSLTIAALLAAGGLWLARSAWRTHAFHTLSMRAGFKTPNGPNFDSNSAASLPRDSQMGPAPGPNNRPNPGQMLRPPVPNRRFADFTPEQRVRFARQGHGPGG